MISQCCFAITCPPLNSKNFYDPQLIKAPDRVSYLPGFGCVNDLELAGTLPTRKKQKDDLNEDDAKLFYWFIESQQKSADTPLVLWLNGGPGASSLYGFFMENGPYHVTKDQTLIKRNHTWTNAAHYMIIDQPAGVGLSDGKNKTYHNEAEAMDQLYYALLTFYERYAELASRPLYIAGESYAGKYIPELSMRILSGNHLHKKINLQGIIIGDGWVNPKVQQASNAAFSYAHGLIDQKTAQEVMKLYHQCASEIDKTSPSTSQAFHICSQIQDLIEKKSGGIYMANVCQNEEPSTQFMVNYLNKKEVRDALHVPKTVPQYSSFSQTVSDILEVGKEDSVASLYATLMKHNIKVLIYNGIDDAKDSNFMGTDQWLSELKWPGQVEFSKANTCVWYVNKKVAGYARTAKELTQIKIRHAGHMAPMDQPEVLLDMLQHFIHHKPYCHD